MNLVVALKIVFLSVPCLAFVTRINRGCKAAARLPFLLQVVSDGQHDHGVAMEIDDIRTPPAFAKNNGPLGAPLGPDFEAEGAHPEPREIVVGAKSHKAMKEAEVPQPSHTKHSLDGPLGPSFNAEGAKPEPREVVVGVEKNEAFGQAVAPPTMTENKGTPRDPMGPSFNAEGAHPEPREIMVGPETN